MSEDCIQTISVYGAGSWGTALALQLARNNIDVLLWDFDAKHVAEYQAARENIHYLSGIPFPDNLQCTDKIEDCIQHSQNQLIVIPSHGFRQLLTQLSLLLSEQHNIVWATKGLETGTGKHQFYSVIAEFLVRNSEQNQPR